MISQTPRPNNKNIDTINRSLLGITHDMLKGEYWQKLTTLEVFRGNIHTFSIKRWIASSRRKKITNVLHEIIPVFHPATIRINALSSSRSRRGILYHLNKHTMVSHKFTRKKKQSLFSRPCLVICIHLQVLNKLYLSYVLNIDLQKGSIILIYITVPHISWWAITITVTQGNSVIKNNGFESKDPATVHRFRNQNQLSQRKR